MTSTLWLLDIYKAGYILLFLSNVIFVAVYTYLSPWWKDRIGKTIVWEAITIALITVPAILSVFFHFSRLTSEVAGWIDAGLVILAGGILLWRSIIWLTEKNPDKRRRKLEEQDEQDKRISRRFTRRLRRRNRRGEKVPEGN